SEGIPDPDAEVGHCVHRVAMHPSRPDVLFMQKHWDVMRSDDAGDSWYEISGDLPTDFGFAIEVHATSPRLSTWSRSRAMPSTTRRKASYVSTGAARAETSGSRSLGACPKPTATSTCCAMPCASTPSTRAA